MSFKVIPTPRFKKEAKLLSKRYRSLKADLLALDALLTAHPVQGISLGGKMYKVRLAIKSKSKGKSGGARVITYLITADHEVFLLTIYDKSEQDTIDTKSLKALVEEIESSKKR